MTRNTANYTSGYGFEAYFSCLPSNCTVRGELLVSERTRKALGLPTRRFGKVLKVTPKGREYFKGKLGFKVPDRVGERIIRSRNGVQAGPGPVRKLEVTLVLDVKVPQSATTDSRHYKIRKSDVLKYYRINRATDKPIGLDICDATMQIQRPKVYRPPMGRCRYSF